jgi:hypothetical protein
MQVNLRAIRRDAKLALTTAHINHELIALIFRYSNRNSTQVGMRMNVTYSGQGWSTRRKRRTTNFM